MLHKAKTMKGYSLDTLDGEIGKVKDFYFDDEFWTVRYLVADTGNWLSGRQVLISPRALVAAIEDEKHIAVDLTKTQIEESPSIAADKPVSRQYESAYHAYYGWGPYWGGPFAWGAYPYPGTVPQLRGSTQPAGLQEADSDPHLRSVRHVDGYHIQATDDEIGHVEDFIIDDVTWAIRYLIVDTRNWLPGKKVLVSPEWLERVSWDESKIFVKLTRDEIKEAPEFTDVSDIDREYERKLHEHFRKEGYWISEDLSERTDTTNK